MAHLIVHLGTCPKPMMFRYFKDIPVGAEFVWSRYRCKKRSVRTAHVGASIVGGTSPNTWFYFGPMDHCHMEVQP